MIKRIKKCKIKNCGTCYIIKLSHGIGRVVLNHFIINPIKAIKEFYKNLTLGRVLVFWLWLPKLILGLVLTYLFLTIPGARDVTVNMPAWQIYYMGIWVPIEAAASYWLWYYKGKITRKYIIIFVVLFLQYIDNIIAMLGFSL